MAPGWGALGRPSPPLSAGRQRHRLPFGHHGPVTEPITPPPADRAPPLVPDAPAASPGPGDREPGWLEAVVAGWLGRGEQVLLAVIGVLLLAGAAAVLGAVVHEFTLIHSRGAAAAVTEILGQVLLSLIMLELLATVLATLRSGTVPLRTVLLVGVVTSVRQIVVVGARLALAQDTPSGPFYRNEVEVAISAGVAVVLTVASWLAGRASTTKARG